MQHPVKFLVICSLRDESAMDRFAALVGEEAGELRRLKSRGIRVEAWSPERPGAVLIIDAASASDAEDIMAQPPLTVAGLIDFDLTPLHDLGI